MGIRQWRIRHKMTDPVRGEFRVSSTYHPPHQADSNFNVMLTGVVTADGVPPTAAEFMDHRMLGYTNRVLPVLVDRADPTASVVLWKEVRPVDYRAQAQEQAQADAQRVSQPRGVTPGNEQSAVVMDPADLPPWLSQAVDAALHGESGSAAPLELHFGDGAGGTSLATGRAAQAVLVGVTDVPTPAYALPGPTASLTDLTLSVQRADGSSYTVATRMGFRSAERRSKLAVIGSTVPIRIDAADETLVRIDVSAWS